VISGDDEGAFGWLALNYQQGRLRPHRQMPATPAGSPAVATSITSLGALDLGGSSLQITFEVPASPSSSSPSRTHASADAGLRAEYNISVAGHTFQLHLHSFKQYGLNEAYDRSITYLLQQQQQQQQQEEQAVLQEQNKSAQPAGNAAGNGTEAASSDVPPAKRAFSNSGNTSSAVPPLPDHLHDSVAIGAAIQHGLSDVSDAGAQANTDAAAVLTSAEPQQAAAVERQRQADLAVAAAAGYHQHGAPLSTVADTSLDSLQASSSNEVGADRASSTRASRSSSNDSGAVDSSSALQGSSSHSGLQSAYSGGAALAELTLQPSAAMHDTASTLASPGLRLQGGQQLPVAARRRASGALRRFLMQQQLAWLEQLLKPSQAHSGTLSNKWQQAHSSTTATRGTQLQHHQQQQADQRSHDVRLRQLLREYLLRDDPAAPPSSATAKLVKVSSTEALDYDSTVVAPHPLVPAEGTLTGSSSSNMGGRRPVVPAPVAVQERAAGSSLSSNGSSKLQVVRHPCLHEGYEAEYIRVAYEGVTPEPAEVCLVH
jgi:hypothetical protein